MAVCLLVEEIRSKRGKPTNLTKVADKLHYEKLYVAHVDTSRIELSYEIDTHFACWYKNNIDHWYRSTLMRERYKSL